MDVLDILLSALAWAKKRDYAGYDPFDALSSPVLKKVAGNSKIMRIIFTQTLKRSPINIRNLMKIEPTRNPKGVALFASTYDMMYNIYGDKRYLKERDSLVDWLFKRCDEEKDFACWGYNFPWQSRRSYLPRENGCSVVTYFVGEAPVIKEDKDTLERIANFYLNELKVLHEDDEHLSLSYTPYEKEEQIVNSNALIGYQLARIGNLTGDKNYSQKSKKIMDWVISQQKKNGGWIYSPTSHLGMDNFHNGYVIWALMKYCGYHGGEKIKKSIDRGLNFYKTMFRGGRPLYSTESEYPVDIHNCAQGMITFKEAKDRGLYSGDLHEDILRWTIDNMWDHKKNYFYYQKHRLWTNKVPYIRWSQAWMCYAMARYMQEAE